VVGWPSDCQVQYYEDELFNLGAKWVKISINEIEPESVLGNGIVSADWSRSEFLVSENQEKCVEALLDNGFSITYILSFWDKFNHPGGWEPLVSRFRTQEEIDRYLDFVRFIVQHFKGRIRYYEIWNEPNNKPPLQWIQLVDYINLVKQTIPVIKQEDPDAKIVIGGIVLQNEDYCGEERIQRSRGRLQYGRSGRLSAGTYSNSGAWHKKPSAPCRADKG
jgi:hypothetical protein